MRPDINRDPWTDEEERLFVEAHKRIGNKWARARPARPGSLRPTWEPTAARPSRHLRWHKT